MKKIVIIILILCSIFLLWFFKNGEIGESQKLNISSQIQYSLFVLNTDKYTAELSFGIREDDFEYDGKSNSKLEYGVLKVFIKGFTGYANKIETVLSIESQNYVYELEKNPFDNMFVCDMQKIINGNKNIQIQIPLLDEMFYSFENISKNWKIDYKVALNIGFKEMKGFILENNNASKSCEIYLTAIDNGRHDTEYFWLFKVQTSQLKTKIIVIDTKTCEIVLKN